jgi:hypothetical protein
VSNVAEIGRVPLTVYLETINPLDLTPEDVQLLADRMHQRLPDIEFVVAYEEQHGSGTTWHEVLHIFLPTADAMKDNSYGVIMGMTAEYMRQRFKRPHGKRRPRSVRVWDAETGREVTGFVIEDPEAEAETTEPTGVERRLPRGRHRS